MKSGTFSFTAKGHADVDGGPVCAAVSAYLYLIAQGQELWQDEAILSKDIRMAPGDSYVSVQYDAGMEDAAAVQWDSVALGFIMLQENYPDRVVMACNNI